MIDFNSHLTSCSPVYNVYTYNFTKEEAEEIDKILKEKERRIDGSMCDMRKTS